jgi:uncharacterized phage protein (TIGR01671 family)
MQGGPAVREIEFRGKNSAGIRRPELRDIFFKGKRIDNGEWLIGNYVFAAGKYYIHLGATTGNHYEVDPESIGQWTGLIDKNNVWIFEGDIVKITSQMDEELVGSICFEYSSWQIDGGDDLYSIYEQIDIGHIIEVIGSIHDTPEELCR